MTFGHARESLLRDDDDYYDNGDDDDMVMMMRRMMMRMMRMMLVNFYESIYQKALSSRCSSMKVSSGNFVDTNYLAIITLK